MVIVIMMGSDGGCRHVIIVIMIVTVIVSVAAVKWICLFINFVLWIILNLKFTKIYKELSKFFFFCGVELKNYKTYTSVLVSLGLSVWSP